MMDTFKNHLHLPVTMIDHSEVRVLLIVDLMDHACVLAASSVHSSEVCQLCNVQAWGLL